MIKKTIKCNDITFENINDILKYKRAGIDHTWHITPQCVDELKKIYNDLYKKIENPDNIMQTANDILIGLDKMLEDAKICRDALKMNSLMQENGLHVDVTDDMDDEAAEIIDRETTKRMEEKSLQTQSPIESKSVETK